MEVGNEVGAEEGKGLERACRGGGIDVDEGLEVG